MIVFQNSCTKKDIAYQLPKSVTCSFKKGENIRLKLVKVDGDSLFFEKYYNQPKNYDCIFTDLKKIKIHDKNEVITYSAFGLSSILLIFCASSAFYCFSTSDGEYGNINLGYAKGLWTPTTIIFSFSTILLANTFPRKFQITKWKLYAK